MEPLAGHRVGTLLDGGDGDETERRAVEEDTAGPAAALAAACLSRRIFIRVTFLRARAQVRVAVFELETVWVDEWHLRRT